MKLIQNNYMYFTENRRINNCKCILLYSLFLFINVSQLQEPNQSSQWNRSVTITTLHFSEVVFPFLQYSRDGSGKSRKEEKRNNWGTEKPWYILSVTIVWFFLVFVVGKFETADTGRAWWGDEWRWWRGRGLPSSGSRWVSRWVSECINDALSLFRGQCSRWWQSSWWRPPALRGNIWWTRITHRKHRQEQENYHHEGVKRSFRSLTIRYLF